MKYLRTFGLVYAVLLVGQSAVAAWEADSGDELQVNAARAIAEFRERIPRTELFFEQAYGYAILPSVTRVGLGFGGAYGKGVVIEGDGAIGTTKFWQFSSGIQAGAKNFSMIVFFKDKQALDYFKKGELQFMGQAGLAFAKRGVAGTPAFNDGIAIVTMARFGFMGEFAAAGGKFSYKPFSDD